ncbi:ATP-binding cassette domain-containing protein [Streptomyces sp. DSM 44915]|uniref:ATP-binding cassette domain-containing protein n=1 Tax=Streptomyces chisholmiae TaxID=3075540 RepID=A0ABU2JP67_9ACTN|nr:ATP-binding cassette domain-containing protein [Streptomyces sp. DSM 44915]MDT0266003.1 ATP-binding cassette domain-containing protein [Streptomyces sp. DSM 44915]
MTTGTMTTGADGVALEVRRLGRRYGRKWALRDATFRLPAGRVCGLVGPNGAGKTTLLEIAAGLRSASTGRAEILGHPAGSAEARARTAFLPQEKPLFRRFTVAETLRLGRELNPGWDQRLAEDFVRAGGVSPTQRVGGLSGGQRTRLALALALGKRPELVLLDEPLADLDPLARRETVAALLGEVAERGITVLLSSHLVAELDTLCDHLLLLSRGGLRLAGDIDEIISVHRMLSAPLGGDTVPAGLTPHTVVETDRHGDRITALVRPGGPVDPGWQSWSPTLEELVLAYLRQADPPPLISPSAHVPGLAQEVPA